MQISEPLVPAQARPATRSWPHDSATRVPYWIYTDPDLYKQELDRFFYGRTWNYVALECEIPEPGSFKRSWIGERSVIVVRTEDGSISVLENRCAHRGAQICWKNKGKVESFTCPYHQWNYNLKGDLQGIPFKRGALGKGGMPKDFDTKEFGLAPLRTHVVGGSIWASFADDVESFEDFCGSEVYAYVERQFPGRKLRLLGYSRQLIPSNWKMYLENLKDPYHATLLHAFYIIFGLWRADSQSETRPGAGGKHGIMTSRNEGKKVTGATSEMTRFNDKLELIDTATVTPRVEFADRKVCGITVFPSVVLHQQANTVGMRHVIPRGVRQFEIAWTYYGYEDDDEEMQRLRLRHTNLMGPAGFVSMEDGEILAQCQAGADGYSNRSAVIEMGGRDIEPQDHMVTEVLIRAFYQYYRGVMGL